MTWRLGILSTHPIQYYSPWYRALAVRPELELTVYYAHRPTAADHAAEGFGVRFEWDVPLLDGYPHQFLTNRARRPRLSGFWGCHTPEIAEIIRRDRFTAFVVHGWYNRSYWQAIRACWQTGTPVLVRGDSTLNPAWSPVRRVVKWLRHRPFVPRFDGYLVVGQRAREYYLAYGADPDRMVFTPHFVDNQWFAEAAAAARPRRTELRRRWGLPEAGVVFLFAGKFIAVKRPVDFVRAIALAARRVPGVTGLMVGDGPLRSDVEAAIRDSAAPVRLAGFLNQSEMPLAYAAGDVLVLPSTSETWGLVVNEAMASGIAAVVTDRVGCGPDLVHDGDTGFVYPVGNIERLADRIAQLGQDLDLLGRLGASARARIHRYSVAAAAEGTLLAVARIAARRSRIGRVGPEDVRARAL